MSDLDYERREAQEFQRQLRQAEHGSIRDRQHARDEFYRYMRDEPKLVADRIGWLIEGNYGYGAHKAAKRIVHASGRTNKVAQLTQWIGAVEWMCPQRFAIAAWKKLTVAEKQALDRAVKHEIESAKRRENE